jgi:uncharacterized protein (DUF983 family)
MALATEKFGSQKALSWTNAPPKRAWWPAVRRGFAGRCPQCGEGRLFGRFLKISPTCATCGEDYTHARADDLPPYLVITVVGHIVGTGILSAETYADWPAWLHMAIWPALTVILSLALIQPLKGVVVAHQWALRMHGFGGVEDEEAVLRPREVGPIAP